MRILNIAICSLTVLALIACSPNETDIDAENASATDPIEIIVTEPVPAEIEFAETTGLKSILDQMHYVSPFTVADVLTETAVVIEGETGETVSTEKVAECYNAFPEGKPQGAISSPVLSKFIAGYYQKKNFSAEAVIQISSEAVSTLGKCEGAVLDTCPGRCINYIAAKSVATALLLKPEIEQPNAVEFLEERELEEGPKDDDG